jgi:hypothetical protein
MAVVRSQFQLQFVTFVKQTFTIYLQFSCRQIQNTSPYCSQVVQFLNLTTRENDMTTKTNARYEVKLFGRGGELNSTYSANPWHPASWITYRGDKVKVFDTLNAQWLPTYVIRADGE